MANIHFASYTTHAKCNNYNVVMMTTMPLMTIRIIIIAIIKTTRLSVTEVGVAGWPAGR